MMLDPSAFDPSVKVVTLFILVSAGELAARKVPMFPGLIEWTAVRINSS